MRIPGIISNVGAETLYLQHQDIIEECWRRRQDWERHFSGRRSCPYGCDGSGVKEIAFSEFGPWDCIPDPLLETVWPHGLITTPCECAM